MEGTAVLNKITAMSQAVEIVEPLLAGTIPVKQLETEGCGI